MGSSLTRALLILVTKKSQKKCVKEKISEINLEIFLMLVFIQLERNHG